MKEATRQTPLMSRHKIRVCRESRHKKFAGLTRKLRTADDRSTFNFLPRKNAAFTIKTRICEMSEAFPCIGLYKRIHDEHKVPSVVTAAILIRLIFKQNPIVINSLYKRVIELITLCITFTSPLSLYLFWVLPYILLIWFIILGFVKFFYYDTKENSFFCRSKVMYDMFKFALLFCHKLPIQVISIKSRDCI